MLSRHVQRSFDLLSPNAERNIASEWQGSSVELQYPLIPRERCSKVTPSETLGVCSGEGVTLKTSVFREAQ